MISQSQIESDDSIAYEKGEQLFAFWHGGTGETPRPSHLLPAISANCGLLLFVLPRTALPAA